MPVALPLQRYVLAAVPSGLQEAIAHEWGVDRSLVSRCFAGDRACDVDRLVRAARLAGVEEEVAERICRLLAGDGRPARGDITDRVLALLEAAGELAATVRTARAEGVLTPAEARAVKGRLAEIRGLLPGVEADADALARVQ